MITLKRPAQAPQTPPALQPNGGSARPKSSWTARITAIALVLAIVVPLVSASALEFDSATSLQKRALALHAHWAYMRENGVPAADLAPLERQWSRSQASRFFGPASVFWLPGAAQAVDRWQHESDAIWSRDIATASSEALMAEQK